MKATPVTTVGNQAVGGTARYDNKPLPRYRQQGGEAPEVVLQPRDLELLRDVWQCRFLTTTQLELVRGSDPDPKLRFVSRLTLTRRLKLLYHNRYLQRIARPLSQGSLEPAYALDTEGVRVLSREHGEVAAWVPAQFPRSVALGHLLGISQVRVSLVAASRQSGQVKLADWQHPEAVRFKAEVGAPGDRSRKATLCPNAFFSLQVAPRRLFYFLAIDQGIEPIRTLAQLCQAYYGYWQSGGFGRDFSLPPAVGFRVLFIAPTPTRRDAIAQAVKLLEAGRTLFWISTEEHINPQEILLPIWQDGATQELRGLMG